MYVLHVDDVDTALCYGIRLLRQHGIVVPTRYGTALTMPCPVTTVYHHPENRVLYNSVRDANPFFHLMEALWMIGGRNDTAWPCQFNSKFIQFSDDGLTYHGAYGFRWRTWFGFDQIASLIAHLKRDPASRRAVLTMWDPERDPKKADAGGKDVPCNTHVYFDLLGGMLNMTVCCRSNDIIWGAYGANAVHFSMLQEYIASALGVRLGEYRQISNNFHLYTNIFPDGKLTEILNGQPKTVYSPDPSPLVNTPIDVWDNDLKNFLSDPISHMYEDKFFSTVALPMYQAWMTHKGKEGNPMLHVGDIASPDWRFAAELWLKRRIK